MMTIIIISKKEIWGWPVESGACYKTTQRIYLNSTGMITDGSLSLGLQIVNYHYIQTLWFIDDSLIKLSFIFSSALLTFHFPPCRGQKRKFRFFFLFFFPFIRMSRAEFECSNRFFTFILSFNLLLFLCWGNAS